MKCVMLPVPEALVGYVQFQIGWAQKKRTGKVEMNFFKGGVTNMNFQCSLKLAAPTEIVHVHVEAGG